MSCEMDSGCQEDKKQGLGQTTNGPLVLYECDSYCEDGVQYYYRTNVFTRMECKVFLKPVHKIIIGLPLNTHYPKGLCNLL